MVPGHQLPPLCVLGLLSDFPNFITGEGRLTENAGEGTGPEPSHQVQEVVERGQPRASSGQAGWSPREAPCGRAAGAGAFGLAAWLLGASACASQLSEGQGGVAQPVTGQSQAGATELGVCAMLHPAPSGGCGERSMWHPAGGVSSLWGLVPQWYLPIPGRRAWTKWRDCVHSQGMRSCFLGSQPLSQLAVAHDLVLANWKPFFFLNRLNRNGLISLTFTEKLSRKEKSSHIPSPSTRSLLKHLGTFVAIDGPVLTHY